MVTHSRFGGEDKKGAWGTWTWLYSLSGLPPAGITAFGPAGWCSRVSLQQMPPGLQGLLSILASERAADTTTGIHVPSAWPLQGHRWGPSRLSMLLERHWRQQRMLVGNSLLPKAKAGRIRPAPLHSSPTPVDGNIILHMGSALI